MQVHTFSFNPFSENTYILSNDLNEAIIIDPGMYFAEENAHFFEYINQHKLAPKHLILTHAHLDHVFGVNWVADTYNLVPVLNRDDQFLYDNATRMAAKYGLKMNELVTNTNGLEHDSSFTFGDEKINVFHTPGHSPGSVCLYQKESGFIIAGDVLFQGSIGRTDLPGGNFDTLIQSIKTHLFSLPDDVIVHSGHGPLTTVGQERISNPFLQE
mgnify:CR=1 FL=1